jgi:Cdc6-like AAA superfamily ATPase
VTTDDLFQGRRKQIDQLLAAIGERGRHAIIYGEPGVGKTSLSQVIKLFVPAKTSRVKYIRKQAFSSDTFSSIWLDIFREMKFIVGEDEDRKEYAVSDIYLASGVTPADVVRELSYFNENDVPIVVIDEFNLVEDKDCSRLMAETIKALSDDGLKASVIIVGIADSVANLIQGHGSITRCTEEVLMPRMAKEEMLDVLDGRIRRLGMTIEGNGKWKAINLTKGLPAFAHGLGKEAALAAIASGRLRILEGDIDTAIDAVINSNQSSLRQDYEKATHSNQARARYKQILMACAMAQSDEIGYFTPKQVEAPLSEILDRATTVEYFNDNLKQLTEERRGKVLYRQGSSRIFRYRFKNPAMQPYVLMRGVRDGFLTEDAMTALSRPEQPDFFQGN